MKSNSMFNLALDIAKMILVNYQTPEETKKLLEVLDEILKQRWSTLPQPSSK